MKKILKNHKYLLLVIPLLVVCILAIISVFAAVNVQRIAAPKTNQNTDSSNSDKKTDSNNPPVEDKKTDSSKNQNSNTPITIKPLPSDLEKWVKNEFDTKIDNTLTPDEQKLYDNDTPKDKEEYLKIIEESKTRFYKDANAPAYNPNKFIMFKPSIIDRSGKKTFSSPDGKNNIYSSYDYKLGATPYYFDKDLKSSLPFNFINVDILNTQFAGNNHILLNIIEHKPYSPTGPQPFPGDPVGNVAGDNTGCFVIDLVSKSSKRLSGLDKDKYGSDCYAIMNSNNEWKILIHDENRNITQYDSDGSNPRTLIKLEKGNNFSKPTLGQYGYYEIFNQNSKKLEKYNF